MSESVVLCEGYLDRAFWAGWLTHLGCTVPGQPGMIRDSLGRLVRNGQHLHHSKSGRHIRVVPCGGKPEVTREARQRLSKRTMKPELTRLVISVDPDVEVGAPGGATGLRVQDVHALARQFDASAIQTPVGDVALDAGSTVVSLVRWEAADSDVVGAPTRQTLERLVCASMVAAYPDRGPSVDRWLKSRPSPPPAHPKEFGWSYMAGWYAEQGCEAFFRIIWKDDKVVAELESRLRECGAWRVAESLADY